MSANRNVRIVAAGFILALVGASGWLAFRTWPREIRSSTKPYPSVQFDQGQMLVPFPTEILLAEVGRFEDELSAYLFSPW